MAFYSCRFAWACVASIQVPDRSEDGSVALQTQDGGEALQRSYRRQSHNSSTPFINRLASCLRTATAFRSLRQALQSSSVFLRQCEQFLTASNLVSTGTA